MMPADPVTMLRSRSYLGLLVLAAVLGVPVSAVAYGFLALVSYLQKELFTHLPHGLGFQTEPVWWPLPMLAVGGVLAAALAIRYLPGRGGPSPADGFKMHGQPSAEQLPGMVLAALATLIFGAVLRPEMPLILIGGGLAALSVRLARRPVPDRARAVVASAGSFAAISTLLGSPLASTFLLMEASGLGGQMLDMALLPGLPGRRGGLADLHRPGRLDRAGPILPGHRRRAAFRPPRPGRVRLGAGHRRGRRPGRLRDRWLGQWLHGYADRQTLIMGPLAGLAVAGLAIGYAEGTGKPSSDVLFSGQAGLPPLVQHAATYTAGALLLLLLCKGLAYGISLGSFRADPTFPAPLLGAAGGIALSHLPGLPMVAGAAMGIGAMSAVMLTLPLTSVLLPAILCPSDALTLTPLVIVAVVVAYAAATRITPKDTATPPAWRSRPQRRPRRGIRGAAAQANWVSDGSATA